MRWLTFLLAVMLAGCGSTAYVLYDDPPSGAALAGQRTVAYETLPAFWQRQPDCAVILPASIETTPGLIEARDVELAAARHLFGRISRVLDPARRDRALRQHALDLNHPADRIRFADRTGCGFGLRLAVEARSGWAMVWAERQIGLAIGLIDLRDDAVLWRARHAARRGAGGAPLSPLSLLVSTGAAARFAADADVPLSLLDDALRRTLATLPDLRGAELRTGVSSR